MSENIRFSVVIPIYNEEEVLEKSYKRIRETMDKTNEAYEILFINDGSRDRSIEILQGLVKQNSNVKLLDFSKNFGHQIAISAGMDHVVGDAIIVIDADLQDPPEVILEMIEKWKDGYDVIYGERSKRIGETIFKKITARLFYRFLRKMTDVHIPVDVGDFRLIDRKVCEALKKLPEKNRFVRGLVSWVGFKQTSVKYVRDKRYAGVSKYPVRKMLLFAMDAIISFSYKPLRLATLIGFFVSMSGFAYIVYALYRKYLTNETIQGWTSLVSITLIFNGAILLMLGIIGEYIARIYDESKNRPLYLIQGYYGFKDQQNL